MLPFDVNNIFSISPIYFPEKALQLFQYQYANNEVYRAWCKLMGVDPTTIKTLFDIPALPIDFFKTHTVYTGSVQPKQYFESSGTTGNINSRHWVKDLELYQKSCLAGFERVYGSVADWCIMGLLPNYLERTHASLVKMVASFIDISRSPESGFYLYNFEELSNHLQSVESTGQKILLIGVSFALLDFAAAFPQQFKNTIVMETGGMKGRKKEITRTELHHTLMAGLGVAAVHSEYGMTELLSQAYATSDGRFVCPPWMKVCVSSETDPLEILEEGQGVLQIIDLANVHSCAFIATQDVGKVYPDGSFEVWGRLDQSDVRGCSLLTV